MKKGSGDDPFADLDSDEDEPVDSASDPQGSTGENQGAAETAEQPDAPGTVTAESAATEDESVTSESSSTKERYTDSPGDRLDADKDRTDDRASETAETVVADTETHGRADGQNSEVASEESVSKAEADGIPWVLRRSRVKEDRDNVHQFFLREEYSAREDEILESVAAELSIRQKDLQKLDVREAMVASADAEDIADVLREWGYEYL